MTVTLPKLAGHVHVGANQLEGLLEQRHAFHLLLLELLRLGNGSLVAARHGDSMVDATVVGGYRSTKSAFGDEYVPPLSPP